MSSVTFVINDSVHLYPKSAKRIVFPPPGTKST